MACSVFQNALACHSTVISYAHEIFMNIYEINNGNVKMVLAQYFKKFTAITKSVVRFFIASIFHTSLIFAGKALLLMPCKMDEI
jgi:hypothetical protein